MNQYRLSRLDRGLRTRHTFKRDISASFAASLRAAGYLTGTLLLALLIWNTSVLSETIEREAGTVARIEAVILSCLTHGAAYLGGELHICRPINTRFAQSAKHLEDVQ